MNKAEVDNFCMYLNVSQRLLVKISKILKLIIPTHFNLLAKIFTEYTVWDNIVYKTGESLLIAKIFMRFIIAIEIYSI